MFTRQSGARRRHLLETLLTGWDSDADDWVFDDFFFWCDMWELGDNGGRHGVPPCPLKSPCTATWSDWKLEASEEAFEEEEEEDSNLKFAALSKGLKETVAKQKPKVKEEAFKEEEEEDSNLEFAALSKGLKETVAKQKPKKVGNPFVVERFIILNSRKEKQKPEVPSRSSPRRKKMEILLEEEELVEILEADE